MEALARRLAAAASLNPAPVKRAIRDPCPGRNGGTIGDIEQFTLLCGVDLSGDDLTSFPADNITQCADACAQYHHPRCAAVAFDAALAHGTNNCYLKTAVPTPTTQSFIMDAAIAAGPTATEDCSAYGPTYTPQAQAAARQGAVDFKLYCGQDYPRDDLSVAFAANMGSCMDQCVQNTSCLGVAYDAAQVNGFQNCYFKSGTDVAGLMTNTFVVDAAFITSISSSSSSSSSPSSTSTSGGAAVSSSGSVPSPAPSASSPSLAWVAGPVIGGVVGLVLVAVAIRWLVVRSRSRSGQSASLAVPKTPMSELADHEMHGGMAHELPAKSKHNGAAELA